MANDHDEIMDRVEKSPLGLLLGDKPEDVSLKAIFTPKGWDEVCPEYSGGVCISESIISIDGKPVDGKN